MKRLSAGLAAAAAALVGGCSALAPDEYTRAVEAEAVPLVHVEQAALVTSRFVLPDAQTAIVGELQIMRTRHEDTFVDIARSYNLGFEELLAANPGIDPWLPGEGIEIILPTRFMLPPGAREGIVINNAQMRLYFFEPPAEDGTQVMYTHPIGIGRIGRATPTGQSTVIDKATDPTWYPPASVRREHAEAGDPLPGIVPPGPDNPLGRHVFRLGLPSYLIHGTNKPPGVGMRSSAGCVRMFPEDIEAMFPLVGRGTPVRLISEPIAVAWHDGQLYIDAHEFLDEDERDPEKLLVELIEQTAEAADQPLGSVDFSRAAQLMRQARGIPLPSARDRVDVGTYLSGVRRVENIVPLPELADEGQVAASGEDAD